MSLVSDWITYILAQDAAGTLGPVPVAAPAHDTPDENGLVALLGLSPDSYYAKFRYAIKEIGDSLPDGHAKDFVAGNVNNANGVYMFTSIETPPCRNVVGTGSAAYVDPRADNIAGTTALASQDNRTGAPLFATVAAATAHFKPLPNPTTNDNFPHP